MTGGRFRFWRRLGRRSVLEPRAAPPKPPLRRVLGDFDMAPDDPLAAYLQRANGVVDIRKLELDSPALRGLRAAGARLVVPLVSQGELLGLIGVGPRRSAQEYSSDDRALLGSLAVQAAPALQLAELVRQQQLEARERERIAQELRVAGFIQQTLLPQELPALAGWRLERYYRPAREVGGDFYDFVDAGDGRLGIIVGDVSDRGVPAALVMATTRAVLRTAVDGLASPGAVLAHVNDALCPEMPPRMFVTCLYAILEPTTGRLRFANAGHHQPYWCHAAGVAELPASGIPLGLVPGTSYDEHTIDLAVGDRVLFYSNGLVEARNPQREMFSFARLEQLVGRPHADGADLVTRVLGELRRFTGHAWEQEDDIMLLLLEHTADERS